MTTAKPHVTCGQCFYPCISNFTGETDEAIRGRTVCLRQGQPGECSFSTPQSRGEQEEQVIGEIPHLSPQIIDALNRAKPEKITLREPCTIVPDEDSLRSLVAQEVAKALRGDLHTSDMLHDLHVKYEVLSREKKQLLALCERYSTLVHDISSKGFSSSSDEQEMCILDRLCKEYE